MALVVDPFSSQPSVVAQVDQPKAVVIYKRKGESLNEALERNGYTLVPMPTAHWSSSLALPIVNDYNVLFPGELDINERIDSLLQIYTLGGLRTAAF